MQRTMKVFSYGIKGYLRYKTMTIENVSSEAQVQIFLVLFIYLFIYLFVYLFLFSRYSCFSVFNHPMIYQICNVMMSIIT